MSGLKAVVRRGFAGGGIATLLLAGLFLIGGEPTQPSTLAMTAWLAAVGVALFIAGTRERVILGTRTVGWPRLAAVGIGVLAVGWGIVGFSQLREFETAGGPWLLTAAITLFSLAYFAWFARECWTGGYYLDEETFAVE
ncbi:hypothetical protein [Natrinema salifodinae]|uniref:Uncharacterized protein n=1 Tax=Natrinema salifodinae TaxID=1202768 RepID=A0A1I0PIG4_9EURY|nr:hypothetical protein [Natrinema salifodinae]SEW13555.1 hypothetical protein SAMN05216285_2552 [Natrinema salifodinae]